MASVIPHRYRWGALAWLLTLQFFVVETVAAAQAAGYSRADDLVSALGASSSPAQLLMNASFVVQGVAIAAGVLLLRPALAGSGGRLAPLLLGAAAIGVLLVGLFPQDGLAALHEAGAGLYLVGGGLGLVALAYALRPRSEAVGTVLALLGLVGIAMTVFFVAGITGYLGAGGTERAAAYVLPLGLALAGALLWRADGSASAGPTEREPEQAGGAAPAGERDAAPEAPARGERPATHPAEPDDDFDPEDPWAQARRD